MVLLQNSFCLKDFSSGNSKCMFVSKPAIKKSALYFKRVINGNVWTTKQLSASFWVNGVIQDFVLQCGNMLIKFRMYYYTQCQ